MIPSLAFVESNTSGTGRLFLRVATDLGYRPILLSADPSRYRHLGETECDLVEADTSNQKALLETCRRLQGSAGLAGIMSSSEYYLVAVARLARQLGLPGPRPSSIRACRDKSRQRSRLHAAAIGIPSFGSARSVPAAVAAARRVGFPVVLKPVSGTGSIGVRLCENAQKVVAHAGELLRQRRNERGLPTPARILVEEFALGPEFSVETFGHEIIGITHKHLGPLPSFVEIGHDFPALLLSETERIIRQTVFRTLIALDLGWGPAHLELRLTAQGPKIIEVNPRLAGGFIPELVRIATGIDLIAETIRLAVGEQPQVVRKRNRHASIRFLLPPVDGTLREVQGLEHAKSISGVVDVQLYARPGERVSQRGDFRDRVGHVIAFSDASGSAQAAAKRARDLIQLRIKPISRQALEKSDGEHRTNLARTHANCPTHSLRLRG